MTALSRADAAVTPPGGCIAPVSRRWLYGDELCSRFSYHWLRFAWEAGIHGSDPPGVGHDRMHVMRPSPIGRLRKQGFSAAYAAAGYCATVVHCRTYPVAE